MRLEGSLARARHHRQAWWQLLWSQSLLRGAIGLLLAMSAALAVAASDGPAAASDDAALIAAGAAIYLDGVLPSGAPLHGTRKEGNQDLSGAAAACVKCHRHSGMGAQEGGYRIPPISGAYLFHASNARSGDAGLPFVPGQRINHQAYDEQGVGRVLREGVDSTGKTLGYLMPRYAMGDGDVRALIAYLKSLSPQAVPGVDTTVLHFATILTPDSDPAKRQAVVDVLKAFVADKNTFPFGPTPQLRASGGGGAGAAKAMYMSNRHWQLHVWQLEGPANSWEAQLKQHLQQEPVMAVLSGLGGDNWAPVHAFCEHERVPCLFPNTEVPVVAPQDFYSMYFSKGVLLEARLIARRISQADEAAAQAPVQQVFRAGDSGEAAALTLAAALKEAGRTSRDLVIPRDAPAAAVGEAVRSARGKGSLVLWLRAADLQALGDIPVPAEPVFVSGLMGGLDQAPLPADWRAHAWLSYPFDLPDRRLVRLEYPLSWFKVRKLPVVAEQIQVDTYLACGLLSETLQHTSDNFSREYLVERLEEMLSHRILTGYYPRLSLAEGQRFASKGGYLVHLPATTGGAPSPDGDWLVP